MSHSPLELALGGQHSGVQRELVSVLIPVYNGERYLAEAIESVLAQSYRPIELIVVDDGSTDGSAQLAQAWPGLSCIRQAHAGAGAALNRGLRLARGSLLAFLDADDLWVDGKLEEQAETLRVHSQLDMVFGHMVQFHSPELDESAKRNLRGARERLPGIVVGALLAKRQVFEKAGLFSDQLQIAYFIDWYGRAVDAGVQSLMLPSTCLQRRLHTKNLGVLRRDAARAEYARVLKDSLDRRRKAAIGSA